MEYTELVIRVLSVFAFLSSSILLALGLLKNRSLYGKKARAYLAMNWDVVRIALFIGLFGLIIFLVSQAIDVLSPVKPFSQLGYILRVVEILFLGSVTTSLMVTLRVVIGMMLAERRVWR